MYKISIRPLARNDIKKIWQYSLINWGNKQADFYISALAAAIQSLPTNPKIGIAIDTVREGYRLYHYKHHLIIYQLTADTIEIVRVLGENMLPNMHL